ncbi:hypothetical protein [Neorhizobium sp. AL 9.2.2]|uniref:hypothetical protein n=1 Tax=Neorhizobium sp. AL 9.2.2 TaxID=2712894 RepID=UPI001574A6D5|nr:hypothetical protein [Neorhizobium sp. AL 9.2.2]NSY16152.1 hypothetical protein [Neorhizobium sp. AL 9.2.2]
MISTELKMHISKARAFAAFTSGSLEAGDEIVASALETLGANHLKSSDKHFTVQLFKEIAKVIADKPVAIPEKHQCIKLRFMRLTPQERIAFWLVEFSHFTDEVAAQILELDSESFNSLLMPSYRKFFQGIALEQPLKPFTPVLLH